MKMNILLLCGGGGSEHEISLRSVKYLEGILNNFEQFQLLTLVLDEVGIYRTYEGQVCFLNHQKHIQSENGSFAWAVDYVIPCFHGFPGETGDFQSYLELMQLPYLGCQAEASRICFNKITTKLWLSALEIPNTPYFFLNQYDEIALEKAQNALKEWGSIFIKAATQGSSVGCYKVDEKEHLSLALQQAFEYSPYVLVEKTVVARELEVAAYEYNDEIVATKAGEIVCADNTFYTFDEKYSESSHATTKVVADLEDVIHEQIQSYAIAAFKGLKLRHLARIDFFLDTDGNILLNEINTFPGLTSISMFPKMLVNHGHKFDVFLEKIILKAIKK